MTKLITRLRKAGIVCMTKLITRLRKAGIVCMDCGEQYGTYSVGCSSVWIGKCDICNEEKPVTETRDYGYLRKGIIDCERGD